MAELPIYFDNMATTPVDPRVAEKMAGYLTQDGVFGNPASNTHPFGWKARAAVEAARADVAALIHAKSEEIVWTSGATEADNLALKGAALFYQRKGKHIITCKTEHKAVLDTCAYLETQGFEVTYLTPQPNGLLALETMEAALRPDTILVSMMHVNNEIGVVQDIAAIGHLLKGRGIIFHVDAAQSVGKLAIDVNAYHIDLLSMSAHKFYGPKGMGALYVRSQPRVRLALQMHGGGHENGFRSGTLATHQIVGMGEACVIAQQEMAGEHARILALREKLLAGIQQLPEIIVHGDLQQRLPGNLNISFNYVDGEALIMALKDLAVSSSSACTSASLEPSYVLRALGVDDELAHSAVRFGLGRFTTEAEVDIAIDLITTQIKRLRELSPLWALYQKQQRAQS